MAKYLILIYGDRQRWENVTDEEMAQIDAGHRAFVTRAGDAILSSGQLEPSNRARSIRAGRGGKPMITDGPFLETKEVLGGFYIIEAAHVNEAVSLASLLGEVRQDHSGVQVHPLVDHG